MKLIKMLKEKIPLKAVKIICVIAVLMGIVGVVSGKWIVGICMLGGAYIFEKSMYRCPVCNARIDMKAPLFRESKCNECGNFLYQRKGNESL